MNEKSFLQIWQSFAHDHNLELSIKDDRNIHGVISTYALKVNPAVALTARISKIGSYHRYDCKMIISGVAHDLNDQHVKLKRFSFFKKTKFEQDIAEALNETDVRELHIDQTNLILKLSKIPTEPEALEKILTIPELLMKLISKRA